ncbi:isoprenoid synthase domain-containing protein [Suillus ampliporus]|nr:isoprenoid synthase domain-containing protein [Suillus ampliporus]
MSIIAAPPTKFILPDLISHCDFKLRMNRHHKQATAESKRWLFRGDNLDQKSRKAIHGLKAGQLTSMCYPDAGFPQLRVCCDFMNYLFHLDNLSDDMDKTGTKVVADVVLNSLHHPYDYYSPTRLNRMTKDFYRRMLPTASRGTCRRFIETMDFFFQAVHLQAIDRAKRVVPDLESYISQRRDTSGCKPCWALIEYANNLNIPDEVMEHPVIQSLGEAANDLVTWSNDIFSYNVEQSKGDTHNMLSVVMHEQCIDLQSAVDFVGELCKQSIDRFKEDRGLIPSWGPKIDKDVAVYVSGLADWIVGSLHWSFDTTRYFQNSGREVKQTRVVSLLPRSK